MDRIRVLIVDDRPIFRAGARGMLGEYQHINVVGEAVSGAEAVRLAKSLKPDVILMDISMPEMDGIRATREILQDSHEVAILGLSVSDHEDDVSSMLEAGACGYILKDSGPEDLARAIEDAHAGRFPLDRSVARKMVPRLAEARPRPRLPPRERRRWTSTSSPRSQGRPSHRGMTKWSSDLNQTVIFRRPHGRAIRPVEGLCRSVPNPTLVSCLPR